MEITSPDSGNTYQVGKPIGKTTTYNLYECILPGNKVGIFKIAADVAYNGDLDREAMILKEMHEKSEALEIEFQETVHDENTRLNYRFLFPTLEESFICTEKEGKGRRVIVVTLFSAFGKLNDLSPVSWIISREKARVDPRSSAWILGKMLKALYFFHSMNISVNFLTGENILINRDRHIVTVFDWSKASMEDELLPDVVLEEIRQVTIAVIVALGGDPLTGKLLEDDQLTDTRYENLLKTFLNRSVKNAGEAHTKFYELIYSLWPKEFHKFQTIIL